MNTDLTAAGVSPFDTIRETRPDGSECWPARDLMPMLGYDRWENFGAAIDRAKISARAQGHTVTSHFRDVTKMVRRSQGGGSKLADVELSRFACYLVAMNGDPRKPEVSAAQHYFAIRTREAETAPTLTGPELLARAVLEAQSMLAAKDAEIAELSGPAAAWDSLAEADGDYSVADAAKILSRDPNVTIGRDRLFLFMQRQGWTYRDRGHRAYQKQIDNGRLAERVGRPYWCTALNKMMLPEPTVRVTPKGLAELLKRLGGGVQLALAASE